MDEVQELFVSSYRKLIEWSDDDPITLVADSQIDESLEELCVSVFNSANIAATSLNKVDGIPTADQKFVRALRDYESRFEKYVLEVWLISSSRKFTEILAISEFELGGMTHDLARRALQMNELMRDMANSFVVNKTNAYRNFGVEAAEDIQSEIKYCNELILKNGGLLNKIDGSRMSQLSAIPALFQRLEMAGIDVSGIFRRVAFTPQVIVPTHVSKKAHNQEKVALYEYVSQAQKAFVAGSYAGAVALLRALIEHILTDYYGSGEGDLVSQINDAKGLPISKSSLQEIRKFANGMLHFSHLINTEGFFLSDTDAEIKISSMFEAVSKLIEGIPKLRVV